LEALNLAIVIHFGGVLRALVSDTLSASSRSAMRSKKAEKSGTNDLFSSRLDQFIDT